MAAQYPGAAGTDANLFIAANNLSTSLSDNPLTIGATTVNVASTTGFPTAGYITIDSEAIAYTSTTGTSFTGCTRGADGTAAASHVTASSVFHDVVAAHHNVLKEEIKAIETDLVASYTGGSTSIATTFAKYLKLIGGTMSGVIAMGANKITGLANGTVATDAAAFGQIPTVTNWASYTPTFTGLGTPTIDGIFWKQIGDTIFINGTIDSGTATAVNVTMTLPNGTTINAAKLGSAGVNARLGSMDGLPTAVGPANLFTVPWTIAMFTDGTNTTTIFFSQTVGGSAYTKAQGGAFGTGNRFTFNVSYPI